MTNQNNKKQEKLSNSSEVFFEGIYESNADLNTYKVDVMVNNKHYTVTMQGETILDCKERTDDQPQHSQSIKKLNMDKDQAVEFLTNIDKDQAVEIVESIQQAHENIGGGALLGALIGTLLTNKA